MEYAISRVEGVYQSNDREVQGENSQGTAGHKDKVATVSQNTGRRRKAL